MTMTKRRRVFILATCGSLACRLTASYPLIAAALQAGDLPRDFSAWRTSGADEPVQ